MLKCLKNLHGGVDSLVINYWYSSCNIFKLLCCTLSVVQQGF